MRALVTMVLFGTSFHGAWAQEPISNRNHRSINLTFARMPFTTRVMPRGEREFSIRYSSANEMRQVGTLLEDAEVTIIVPRWRWGGRDGEILLEVPLVSRGGGFLDSIISGWHKSVLQYHDPVREARPKGQSVIRDAGRYSFGSATGIGDVTLVASRAVAPSVTAKALIKLPTGNPNDLLGSGRFDSGLGMTYRNRLHRQWEFATSVAIILQGGSARLPNVERTVSQWGAYLAYVPNSRDVWSIQIEQESRPMRTGFKAVDGPQRQSTIGFRRRLNSQESLELFFAEDGDWSSLLGDVAPDFSIGLRWISRF